MALALLFAARSSHRARSIPGPGATLPDPSAGTVIWDTRSGGNESIQGAANLAAALSAGGFGASPTVTSPSTLEWDAADSLSIPGAPKVFKLTYTPDGTTEQEITIARGLSIAASKDVYLQYKRFQAAGFDNTPGFGRKFMIWFQNDSPQVRYACTLSAAGLVRLFRDGDAYSGSDPTSAGTDGSRAEARWAGAGGDSNGGTVPAPNGTAWHPDDTIGTVNTITCRIKGESSGGAGDGILETWHNGVRCDQITGLYTSNLAWSSEFQMNSTWNYPASGPYTEALWDWVVWRMD